MTHRLIRRLHLSRPGRRGAPQPPYGPEVGRGALVKALLVGATAATVAALVGAPPAHAAPAAPVIRDVVTGGDSIAVLWDPAPGTTPASYTVYRGGTAVATVPPAPTGGRLSTTTRYIDTNVVRGQSYQYKVTMTAADGGVSGFSATRSATHPLAQNTTPVPTVTVDATNPAYRPVLDEGAAVIRAWYPKFADRIARPGYQPPPSITLTHLADTGYVAYASGTTIVIDDSYLATASGNIDAAAKASFLGVFLHEMTHVLQAYPSGPSWLAEGVAVWATHEIYHDADILTPAFSQLGYYSAGYEAAARFLKWLATDPAAPWTSTSYTRADLVRDANVAAHAGTFDGNFFVTRTGKKPAVLWGQMAGITGITDQKFLPAGSGSLCLDDRGNKQDDNNEVQLGNCWNSGAQIVASFPTTAGAAVNQLVVVGKCLDVYGGGSPADGTKVVIYTCTEGATWQYWTFPGDGTLRHHYSGKCVQPTGGVLANGVGLEVRRCDGSAAQRWTRQAL